MDGSIPQTPFETWTTRTVYQKIQEAVEDYENGRLSEEQLVEFLQELNLKDEEHFLDKMDEYNEDLRFRLQKIHIANQALEAAGMIAAIDASIDKDPGFDEKAKLELNKELNNAVLNIKDPGDAAQVVDGITNAVNKLESKAEVASAHQDKINAMRDIAMGLRVDYLGATRTSLGTGTVLGGPLGEIAGLGFDKMQVEADNDGTKYISGFISSARHDFASAIKSTATALINSPRLDIS